jgi:ureidoglycolate hydrolase
VADATTIREVRIRPRPLTAEAFAPFGHVVGPDQLILETKEFPMFTNLVTLRPADEPITYINRHHDHNQLFVTVGGAKMIVIVARPDLPGAGFDPTNIEAFETDGNQAIVFHIDTWHIAPRGVGPGSVRAINVQATNNLVHTERIELEDQGYRTRLDLNR